jgi:pimeloyl-ACP methyl ester carboxylesterase
MSKLASVATACGPIEVADVWEGAPVLVVHGGMGGQDQGLILAKALGLSDHRVLSVSRPGYLGTPLASGVSPQAQADLYAALLDTLGIARVVVVAVSAGGVSALEFAVRHRARTRGVVLVSAATGTLKAPGDYARRMQLLKVLARIPFLGALQTWRRKRDPGGATRKAISDPDLRARTLAHPTAGPLLRSFLTVTFRRLAERLPGTANDIETLAALPSLPLVVPDVPVLCLHGTADVVAPFAQAQALAAAIASVEVAEIVGGEHLVLFTHLDVVRARLRRFLATLPA